MYSRAEPGSVVPVPAAAPTERRRKWILRGLQLVATLGAFGYVLSLVSPSALFQALARVSFVHFGAAMLLTVVALGLGSLRWSLLFTAFGAPHPPALARVFRYYAVGFFYNTCVPGGVGGDLVRALASRRAWGAERAATAGIATVLIDRVFGLSGMLGLIAIVSLVHPLPVLGSAWLPGLLGLSAAVAPLAVLSAANWLTPRSPPLVAKFLARLPVPARFLPLTAAASISLLTQLVPALSGYLIVSSIDPAAGLLDSLLIVPLASASAFLPITVSGAGVREAIFVTLYESVGVAADSALATSLLLWCSQICVAVVVGLIALARPIDDTR